MSTTATGESPRVPGQVEDQSRIADEDVSFTGAGGDTVGAYLARPAAGGVHPGLIVIQEAGGLNEHIRDVARRFANQGYVALAPDLYAREGGPPPAGDLQALMQRIFSMPDARVLGDLEAAADLLGAREDVSDKLGCIGFCMGGRYTLLLAGSTQLLSAAVDCWGGFIDRATPDQERTPERPVPPLELVDRLSCPLLAAIGAEDQNPSPEIGEELRRRLEQTPRETQVVVYPDAGHAFFNDTRHRYRPAAAARLWEDVLRFLDRHLR